MLRYTRKYKYYEFLTYHTQVSYKHDKRTKQCTDFSVILRNNLNNIIVNQSFMEKEILEKYSE